MIQAGVGAWGASWSKVVAGSPHWELVALVDPAPEALERAGESLAISPGARFATLGPALAEVEADAVLVAAPPAAHGTLALEALGAGLHCLVEKPLTPSIGEARSAVKRAAETGRILMVSQNYRFGRGYRTVQGLVRDGAIGPVEVVQVDFRRAPLFKGFRLELEEPLLVDMAVHHLDQARGLLGSRPAEVRARSFNPSWSAFGGNAAALVEVVFEEGAVVSYAGTWAGRGPETSWDGDWYLQGAEGALVWRENEVRLFDPVPAQQGRIARRLRRPEGRRVDLLPLAETERAGVLAELAAAIREGRDPETSGDDNLQTLELTFAAIESASSGDAVSLL
jgi:predicted dehydrogenase